MEDEKVSIAQFFNLLKQYWKSNPDKSYKEIISTLLDMDLANDYNIEHKIEEIILPEDRAYKKLKKLCSQGDNIDEFLANKIIKL